MAASLEDLLKTVCELETRVDGMNTRIQAISEAIPDDRGRGKLLTFIGRSSS